MALLIVDIDGTLADDKSRAVRALIPSGGINWDVLYHPEWVLRDGTIISPIVLRKVQYLLRIMAPGVEMIYLTGREARPELVAATYYWLATNQYPFATVFFRERGDYRPDHLMKGDALNRILPDYKPPFWSIDDCGKGYKDPVLMQEMYRSLSISLWDPAEIVESSGECICG